MRRCVINNHARASAHARNRVRHANVAQLRDNNDDARMTNDERSQSSNDETMWQ
jgi:hypothetical protein